MLTIERGIVGSSASRNKKALNLLEFFRMLIQATKLYHALFISLKPRSIIKAPMYCIVLLSKFLHKKVLNVWRQLHIRFYILFLEWYILYLILSYAYDFIVLDLFYLLAFELIS